MSGVNFNLPKSLTISKKRNDEFRINLRIFKIYKMITITDAGRGKQSVIKGPSSKEHIIISNNIYARRQYFIQC